MKFEYVIGVMTKNGKWIFATTDFYGVPRFTNSYIECRQFTSIESAESWFAANRSRMFNGYYSVDDVDLSTLTVRQIVCQEVTKLELVINTHRRSVNRMFFD